MHVLCSTRSFKVYNYSIYESVSPVLRPFGTASSVREYFIFCFYIPVLRPTGIPYYPASEHVYNYRQRGQIRQGYGSTINQLCHDYVNLTGSLFDPDSVEESQPQGGVVVPDLSKIPMGILQAYILYLEENKAQTSTHSDYFKVFANEFSRLNTECRAAAFIGQSGAGAK